MSALYSWDGRYFGFVSNGRVFDANSRYVGWVEDDGRAWRADGSFLGEMVDDSYILRNINIAEPARRARRGQPGRPGVRGRPGDRGARAKRVGRIDPLAKMLDG